MLLDLASSGLIYLFFAGPAAALLMAAWKLHRAGRSVWAGAILAFSGVASLALSGWNPIDALSIFLTFLVPGLMQLFWLSAYVPVYLLSLGLLAATSVGLALRLSQLRGWRKSFRIGALAAAMIATFFAFDIGVRGYIALSAWQDFGSDYRVTRIRSPFESVERSWGQCASGHHAKLEHLGDEYHWSYRSGWVRTDFSARCVDGPSLLIDASIIGMFAGIVSWLFVLAAALTVRRK